MLILHGTNDWVVAFQQSEHLHAAAMCKIEEDACSRRFRTL